MYNQQPSDNKPFSFDPENFADFINPAMFEAGISEDKVIRIMETFSRTSQSWCMLFKEELNKRALNKLLHAVIDDDRKIVETILKIKPELLLLNPQKKPRYKKPTELA